MCSPRWPACLFFLSVARIQGCTTVPGRSLRLGAFALTVSSLPWGLTAPFELVCVGWQVYIYPRSEDHLLKRLFVEAVCFCHTIPVSFFDILVENQAAVYSWVCLSSVPQCTCLVLWHYLLFIHPWLVSEVSKCGMSSAAPSLLLLLKAGWLAIQWLPTSFFKSTLGFVKSFSVSAHVSSALGSVWWINMTDVCMLNLDLWSNVHFIIVNVFFFF